MEIANLVRMLTLPNEILIMVEKGDLSAGHARTLIGIQNSIGIAKKIIEKKLSVRQAESLTRQFKNQKLKLIHKKDPNILDLQKSLEDKTGLNVSINNRKNNTGTISFEYSDLDQLDRLLSLALETELHRRHLKQPLNCSILDELQPSHLLLLQ